MNNEPSHSSNINVSATTGMGNTVNANSIENAGVKNVYNITQMDKGQQPLKEKGPIWFDVRCPVKSFTGRDVELKDLHDALHSEGGELLASQFTSISGLGGIGKSELARKYAHKYKEVYDGNVIWINAETQESLRKSFQGLAKKLTIPITEKRGDRGKEQERDIKSIVEDVYEYVQNRKSLFIFDNAEEYKDINEFLPYSFSLFPDNNKPYVLITSRNRDWKIEEEGEIKLVQLGELTPEGAAQFIRKAFKLGDKIDNLLKTQIEQLAKQLQYFPLALRQAITYIKDKNKIKFKKFEITDYLKEYEEEAKKLLDFKYASDRYTKTTFVTWKVTIDNIKQKEYGQEALNILYIMAYLSPDNDPIENFFSKLMEDEDEEKLWDAVELLSQYSMINVEKGVSNIHRLVQQVVRLGLQNENKEEEILNEVLNNLNNANVAINAACNDHLTSIWNYASKYGKLIDDYCFDSIYGWLKYTPLHLLVQNGCHKAIKAILKHIEKYHSNKLNEIFNAIDKYGRTPLHLAAQEGKLDLVKYFIEEKGADFNVPDNNGRTPLLRAASCGKLDIVKYLIEEKGADFNVPDNYGMTPLDWASGRLDLVKYLIEEKGADFNVPDNDGNTLLCMAAENSDLDLVKYLIEEKGADFNVPDEYGKTPLHLAAESGELDLVKYLIEEKGADFNVTDNDGNTLLCMAAESGDLDLVKYLIEEKGADLNVVDKSGHTLLDWAYERSKWDLYIYISSIESTR